MQRGSRNVREGGFNYLGLLCAIAVLSVGLLAGSEVWVTTARRERMQELDWVGAQFVQAIGSYYESSPGSVKTFPPSLAALVDDRRFLTTRRHLRQIYRNPFTNQADWAIVLHPTGGIVGVRAQFASGEGQVSSKEYRYQPGRAE